MREENDEAMPQAGAGSWRSHGIISLYGKGSLHTNLLEATFRARRRADKRNYCEGRHQRILTKYLDRHQKAENNSMEKELARTRRAVEEKEALLEVLQSFRGDKLQTMRFGFRPELVTPTPENIQRCRMERRVLQRGFSVGTLYPEVLKALQERKLDKKPERRHDTLLKDARMLSDFLIDRRITDAAMKHERPIHEEQQQPSEWLQRNDNSSDQPCGNKVTRPKPLTFELSTPLPPIRKHTDASDSEMAGENSSTDQKSQTTEEKDFVPRLKAKKLLPPIAKESQVLVQTETPNEQIADETCGPHDLIRRSGTVVSQTLSFHSAAKYSKAVTLR